MSLQRPSQRYDTGVPSPPLCISSVRDSTGHASLSASTPSACPLSTPKTSPIKPLLSFACKPTPEAYPTATRSQSQPPSHSPLSVTHHRKCPHPTTRSKEDPKSAPKVCGFPNAQAESKDLDPHRTPQSKLKSYPTAPATSIPAPLRGS